MKKTLSGCIVATVLLFFFLSGCKKTEDAFHYVKLSQISCSFNGSDNLPLTISVETSPVAYEATCDNTWVKVQKNEDGTGITLTVADNETDAEREGTVTVTAGEVSRQILVQQLAKDNKISRYRRMDAYWANTCAISPSGKYVGAVGETLEGEVWYNTPTIFDTETGETYEFGPYPESYGLGQVYAMSDDGLMFIATGQSGGQVVIDINGDMFVPEVAGYENKPEISSTSADGKYWVGYILQGMQKPLLWTDGVAEELPMPEKNYRNEEFWAGVLARGISSNGKIIYGTSWENDDCGMLYWTIDGSEISQPRWVGDDVRKVTPVIVEDWMGEYEYNIVDGCISTAEPYKVSPSGRWIATSFREEVIGSDGYVSYVQRPAFYNTETETTTIIDDYGEATGMFATDDGIAFIGLGTMALTVAKVYDLNTSTDLGDVVDWVSQNYGIIIPGGCIEYVSPSGHLFGNFFVDTHYIDWYVIPVR